MSRPVTTVRTVGPDDVAALVDSVAQLFVEDAGVHDPWSDTSWPTRQGLEHYEALRHDGRCLLLLALAPDGTVIGHLVGKLSPPTGTRRCTEAVLESILVEREHRGRGAGAALVDELLAWGRAHGASRAAVSAYARNEGARAFYRRHGFEPQSVTLHRALD